MVNEELLALVESFSDDVRFTVADEVYSYTILPHQVPKLFAAYEAAQPPNRPAIETLLMRMLADHLAASSTMDEDSRIEVAYAISRHLGLEWPAARATASTTDAGVAG